MYVSAPAAAWVEASNIARRTVAAGVEARAAIPVAFKNPSATPSVPRAGWPDAETNGLRAHSKVEMRRSRGKPVSLPANLIAPKPHDGISRCHQPRRGFADFSLTWWTGLESDGGAPSGDGVCGAGSGSPVIGCSSRVSLPGAVGETPAACSPPAASSERE